MGTTMAELIRPPKSLLRGAGRAQGKAGGGPGQQGGAGGVVDVMGVFDRLTFHGGLLLGMNIEH